MSEFRIIDVKKAHYWLSGHAFHLTTIEDFFEDCTRSLRTPDEWTDADWQEYWADKHVRTPEGDVMRAWIIATRPPSDPVADMDALLTEATKLPSIVSVTELQEQFEKVKEHYHEQ